MARPLMFAGERRESGAVLEVTALEAAALVDSTRATLENASDAEYLLHAIVQASKRAIADGERAQARPRQVNPRWQKVA